MKMKTFMQLLLAAVLVAGTGCGEKENSKPEAKTKTLLMVTEATFPPYEFFKGKEIVGIDVEIVREAARRSGYLLKVEHMPFDSVITAVQAGKADIAASGITVTEDRKKSVDFTIPYVKARQVIIVPAKTEITKPGDLKGKRIGVQHGTTGAAYVEKNFQQPERFENGALAAAALKAGKLDAVVLDEDPASVHVSLSSGKLKILPDALTSEEYAFALKKGRKELFEPFNNALKEMEKEGFFKAVITKYKTEKNK